MSEAVRKILVVFDIDETLLQFLNKNAYSKYWDTTFDCAKREILENFTTLDNKERQQLIIFRPGLNEFLNFVKQKAGQIEIALWTYSEREYAENIGKAITETFNLEHNPFIFQYGAEDIEDDDIPKSLQQIWDDYEEYDKFNTFIVDDRLGNLSHEVNKENSILVEGFAPFGETKPREPLTQKLLNRAINDKMFIELQEIINKLLKDIDGCDDDDIKCAFDKESIFTEKTIKRKNLSKNYNTINSTVGKMITIGDITNADFHGKGSKGVGSLLKYLSTRRKAKNKTMKRKTIKRKTIKRKKLKSKKRNNKKRKTIKRKNKNKVKK